MSASRSDTGVDRMGDIEHVPSTDTRYEREPLYASRPPIGSTIEPGPGVHLINVTDLYVPAEQLRGAVEENRRLNDLLNDEINAKARFAREAEELRAKLASLTDTGGR